MQIQIILNEDIEDDVNQRTTENVSLLKQVSDIFVRNGFEVSEQINGTSFEKEMDFLTASFYVSSDIEYKGFITNETEGSSNYSVKGNREQILNAVDRFIDEFDKEQRRSD